MILEMDSKSTELSEQVKKVQNDKDKEIQIFKDKFH